MFAYWDALNKALKRLLVIIVFMLAALCFAYAFLPEMREQLLFLSAFSGSIPVAFASYHAARSFQVSVERDKLHKSFEILCNMNARDVSDTRYRIERKVKEFNGDLDLLCKKINEDVGLYDDVNHVLGMFEDMTIAIRKGYTDESMLHKSLASVVRNLHRDLLPYIVKLRIDEGDSLYYTEFEDLERCWSRNQSIVDERIVFSK